MLANLAHNLNRPDPRTPKTGQITGLMELPRCFPSRWAGASKAIQYNDELTTLWPPDMTPVEHWSSPMDAIHLPAVRIL